MTMFLWIVLGVFFFGALGYLWITTDLEIKELNEEYELLMEKLLNEEEES